jgi:hypothetical protein
MAAARDGRDPGGDDLDGTHGRTRVSWSTRRMTRLRRALVWLVVGLLVLTLVATLLVDTAA